MRTSRQQMSGAVRRLQRAIVLLVILAASLGIFCTAQTGECTDQFNDDLGNITVHSSRDPVRSFTLSKGEYREPSAPGSASMTTVKLTDLRAYGNIDGQDIAAVVIIMDSGGSGTFSDLALLIKKPVGWVNSDTAELGDRIKVHSISCKGKEIAVSLMGHGPRDALCCPTQERTLRFTVLGEHLISQDTQKTPSEKSAIIGPEWQWFQTRYQDSSIVVRPVASSGYTLRLKSDGTVQIRGDCNVGGGSFKLSDSQLTITITHSTMAYCPEGSLEEPFIHDLNRISAWHLKTTGLYLDLQNNAGTMEFYEVSRTPR